MRTKTKPDKKATMVAITAVLIVAAAAVGVVALIKGGTDEPVTESEPTGTRQSTAIKQPELQTEPDISPADEPQTAPETPEQTAQETPERTPGQTTDAQQQIEDEKADPYTTLPVEPIIPQETPEQAIARGAYMAFLTGSLHALHNGEDLVIKDLLDGGAYDYAFAATHGSDVPELLIQSYDYIDDDDHISTWSIRYENGKIIARNDKSAARNSIRRDGSYHSYVSPGMGYIYDGNTDEGYAYDQTVMDVYLIDGASVSREGFYALRKVFFAKDKVEWIGFTHWSDALRTHVPYSQEELTSRFEDGWIAYLLFLSGDDEPAWPPNHTIVYDPTTHGIWGGRIPLYEFVSDEAEAVVTPCLAYEIFLNGMGGTYDYALEYLRFEGIPGAQAINEFFYNRRLGYHLVYTSDNFFFKAPWEGMGEVEAFDPVSVIGGMVSVVYVHDGDAGGTGWGPNFGGFVFDMNTGEELSAGDVFGKDDAVIRKLICDYIAGYTSEYPDEFWVTLSIDPYSEEGYDEINKFKFFLTKDALVACYDKYELFRTGAHGGCTITVPFSAIGEPIARTQGA